MPNAPPLYAAGLCRNICPRGVPAGGDVTRGAPDITYALKSLPINLSCLVGSQVGGFSEEIRTEDKAWIFLGVGLAIKSLSV